MENMWKKIFCNNIIHYNEYSLSFDITNVRVCSYKFVFIMVNTF